jgi:predicted RNA binding protein YcfA (HicA-like mRNA interferase family)
MPDLRVLSGEDVISILNTFDFVPESQRGSHVKLKRVLSNGAKQVLTIPNHGELDKGTLKAIFRQSLKYIPEEELRPHFYTK